MADRLFISKYLETYFDELEVKEFYRLLFPVGELETTGQQEQGKYNAIAVELLPKESKLNARKYVITDDLAIIDKLLKSDNFIIVSPISYAGKSRDADNARYIYAMAIDLDGVANEQYLTDFFWQIENEKLPEPTYIVWSGTGIHLYYQFEQPIPCFKNITKQLQELKSGLTRRIWNSFVTELHDKPQIQSLFQGFRMPGCVTKGGNRARVFETGKKIDIEYLNQFVDKQYQVVSFTYKSKLTLSKAKVEYPDWYERRIVNKQPKGTWQCKVDLYNWWLRRLHSEIKEGHRYYGLMCLCIYAKKCGVGREQLENDAFGMLDEMEKLTTNEENHFTREDILAALELYNDNYITFPIDSITELTQIPIEKNKRNYLPQKVHLDAARNRKNILKKHGLLQSEGRPSMRESVERWQWEHKNGTIKECINDTGLSRSTVYKYWKGGGV